MGFSEGSREEWDSETTKRDNHEKDVEAAVDSKSQIDLYNIHLIFPSISCISLNNLGAQWLSRPMTRRYVVLTKTGSNPTVTLQIFYSGNLP